MRSKTSTLGVWSETNDLGVKIIFVTGWIVSWLGKWITTASVAKILQSTWLKIWVLKMDPYLQVDAWTMSPYEHGEVFVTDDWWETDLDLGNYERFLWVSLGKDNNITTWKIYLNVIQKERKWEYLWKTVQIVPHITNEIKENILKIAKNNDITLVEVWWTVWDIESLPFLEAIRQLKRDLWKQNVFYIHVTLLLELDFSGEIKTKPIQHSIIKLREYWISADMLFCRTGKNISTQMIEKISNLCDIDTDKIIEAKNAKTIYRVPELLKQQKVGESILNHFWFENKKVNLDYWNELVWKIENPENTISVWIIGKYTNFEDTYKSIVESLIHAWAKFWVKIKLNFIDSEKLENSNYKEILNNFRKSWDLDWILIPWWFWSRWIEWMINSVTFARENNIPFLWICLWLQVSVIEFARNIIWIKDANSSEFISWKNNVIDIMQDQKYIENLGWTMRLWEYKAILKKWSLTYDLYKKYSLYKEENNEFIIWERHRHRYEVNPIFVESLEKNGLTISWIAKNIWLVEFIENNSCKFFVATQAHPEFKSTLEKWHPLFLGLIEAIL